MADNQGKHIYNDKDVTHLDITVFTLLVVYAGALAAIFTFALIFGWI